VSMRLDQAGKSLQPHAHQAAEKVGGSVILLSRRSP
jgi:hypothetical protein